MRGQLHGIDARRGHSGAKMRRGLIDSLDAAIDVLDDKAREGPEIYVKRHQRQNMAKGTRIIFPAIVEHFPEYVARLRHTIENAVDEIKRQIAPPVADRQRGG